VTVTITVCTVVTLVINNVILKPRLAKVTKVPVPIELILVVVGTLVCWGADLADKHDVDILRHIPTGIPSPALPPLSLAGAVAVPSLVIAIVAYASSFSLAKIFALKHGYRVDPNQELYAMGWGNILSSLFSCAPMASAISRNVVQDSAGGKTQVAGLVTAFMMIWVMLFIGPLFESLPEAVLGSIILVALKGMFMQAGDMVRMWAVSKADAMLWIVTFAAVVLIDVDLGLLVGVLACVALLVARGQRPSVVVLGRVHSTDVFLDLRKFKKAVALPGVTILSIFGSLHFANKENMRSRIVKASGIDPTVSKKGESIDENKNQDLAKSVPKPHLLVIDLSCVPEVDVAAARALEDLVGSYRAAGVAVRLAGPNNKVAVTLEICGSLSNMGETSVFHDLADAIVDYPLHETTSPLE